MDFLKTLSETYGPLLAAGAILLSAIIGGTIAITAIFTQRNVARKRATLDLLSRQEWDGDYISARKRFIELRDSGEGFIKYAAPEFRTKGEVADIKNILNGYELIAVGIKIGILDEDLYKLWFRSAFLKDWVMARQFIRTIRTEAGEHPDEPKIFCEYEGLVRKWVQEENVNSDPWNYKLEDGA